MSWAGKFDGRGQRTARHLQQLMVVAFNSAIAMRYCLAAQRDEKNGFSLTAAMEWRETAELLAPHRSDFGPVLARVGADHAPAAAPGRAYR